MSVIVPSVAANRIYQQFDTEFDLAIKGAPRIWPAYAREVPSSSHSTLHLWLANQLARVREWKGSRVLNDFGALAFEVVNRNWELSFRFLENQLRDDESGIVAMALDAARSNADKWAEHEDGLIAQTIQGGKVTTTFDGQPMFGTHPTDPLGVVSGTFSNLLTAKPLTAPNLVTALQTLRGYTLPDGAPWVGPNSKIQLIVENSNLEIAKQLAGTPWMSLAAAFGVAAAAAPSVNVLSGSIDPLYNGWFNNEPGVWYLAASNGGVKPVMLQRRQDVETEELGPGSQIHFERKEYVIGQDARYAAAFTIPQLMIRVEPT